MTSAHHDSCFGRMFPEVLGDRSGVSERGKVFSILTERVGGLWQGRREVQADMSQWEACRACPRFDECYQFSTAKLLLSAAVVNR